MTEVLSQDFCLTIKFMLASIHSFISLLLNKHLMNDHCVPGTALGIQRVAYSERNTLLIVFKKEKMLYIVNEVTETFLRARRVPLGIS